MAGTVLRPVGRLRAPGGGYGGAMSHHDSKRRDDQQHGREAEDVLEAFNAGDVVEHPGEPPRPHGSPADEKDIPAPPG